jgi:hypothetical protein
MLGFVAWGPMAFLPQALLPRVASAAAPASSPHNDSCVCKLCRGMNACCCHPTKSALETLALRANCETPDSGVPIAKSKLPPALPLASAPLYLCVSKPPVPACDPNLVSSVYPPLERPPRSL